MQVLTALEPERIGELRRNDEFFWLDLVAPEPTVVDQLGELLELHPIALEEFREFDESRAHLHPFGDYMVLVYFAASSLAAEDTKADVAIHEVHLFVSGDCVVTVRQEPCRELDLLRDRLKTESGRSEEFVVYRVLDSLTDTFFPVLSGIAEHIDQLEEAVMENASEEQLQELRAIKRELVTLRSVVNSQRDLFGVITDEIDRLPGLEQDERAYLRSTYDHLIRISEQIEDYRDLLSNVRDVYVSTVSNRLNEIMKRLTIIATIFLPLSFLTGFFGQNFGWLTDHMDSFGVFIGLGVGLLLSSVLLLFMWFRRSGLL